MDGVLNKPNSSFPGQETLSHVFSDGSNLDEPAMERQLMDIESSFLPELSPRAKKRYTHQDSPKVTSFNSRMLANPHSIAAVAETKDNASQGLIESPSHLINASSPGGMVRHNMITEKFNFEVGSLGKDLVMQGSNETQSPTVTTGKRSTAQIAAQTLQGLPSETSVFYQDEVPVSHDHGRPLQQGTEFSTATPGANDLPATTSSSNVPTGVREHQAFRMSAEPGTQVNEAATNVSLQSTNRVQNRPLWLKAHQAHQRFSQESGSSYVSQLTAGLDYDPESGGATPASKGTLRVSKELSRIPSLGSVASSIGTNDSSKRKRQAQARAAQSLNGGGTIHDLAANQASPKTPRPFKGIVNQATHSSPNQRERGSELPGFTLRDNKATSVTDDGPFLSTGGSYFGRGKADLTLKEQNSRIDKLSKENFDLKLKIHYLYQALQDRSDEGVKDLVSKNAQIQTDLLKIRKENQSLKKSLRESHRQDSSRQGSRFEESEDDRSSKDFRQSQLEDEILWLRGRMQYLETENDKLSQEGVSREFEKRRLADQIRALGSGSAEHSEDVWRDLLDAESARRQQAEIQLRSVNQEMAQLKSVRSTAHALRRQQSQSNLNNVREGTHSGSFVFDSTESFSGSTAVGLEQLRRENAELRRNLGAQTSMLTSRNRERERLQEQIENLKLEQRRGEGSRSTAGDSILDRSVSRQNLRPISRSANSQPSHVSDSEREHFEANEAALRDENMIIKMRLQDLQRDLDFVMGGAEHIDKLRAERDEALRLGDEDRDWAANTINDMEVALETKSSVILRLQAELEEKVEEFDALQQDNRSVREGLHRVADDCDASQSTIQDLQQSLANATGEIESLEQGIKDATQAKERLEVQQESSQNEIAFLREEQEADKIKISEIEAVIRMLKDDECEYHESMKLVTDLRSDLEVARKDIHQLHGALKGREAEMRSSEQQFEYFEEQLRSLLGKVGGNRLDIVSNVNQLKMDHENAIVKANDDILIRQEHERLMDSHFQENNRLAILLEQEKQGRKEDANTHARTERSLRNSLALRQSAEDKALERLDMQKLEERNQLCLSVWQRFARLCGSNWVERQRIQEPNLATITDSLESVGRLFDLAFNAIEKTLSSFRKRLRSFESDMRRDFAAIDAALYSRAYQLDGLEKTMSRSSSSVGRSAISDLLHLEEENLNLVKEVQILRHQQAFQQTSLAAGEIGLQSALKFDASATETAGSGDVATAAAQTAIARDHERTNGTSQSTEIGQADYYRRRSQVNSPLPASSEAQRRSISALVPRQRPPSSTADRSNFLATTATSPTNAIGEMIDPTLSAPDQRWLLRMREADARLLKEREGRVLDREGARKRLEEGRIEIEQLRKEVERLRAV